MSPRRPLSSLLVAGAVLCCGVGALAGCGTGTATEEAASSSSAPTSGAAGPSSAPTSAGVEDVSTDAGSTSTFPADTRPDTADAAGATGLTVTAVRAAAHDGFDRVVFEFAGEGTPGWDVQYVAEATAEGTGKPLGLAGPDFLRVVLRGVTNPYEAAAPELTRGAAAVGGTDVVTGAFYDGTVEGQALAYVGTRSTAPFRVYALTGPSRLVVDVAVR
jgi:hypothetical protein